MAVASISSQLRSRLGLTAFLVLCPQWACALPDEPQTLRVEVVAEFPHDPGSFTQGLLWHEGALYESTGQFGASRLRRIDPETAEVALERRLGDRLFGEGLARVDDRLIQLTWHAGTAFVYDLSDFELLKTFRYRGEGWGLCYDCLLYTSPSPRDL